MTIDNLRILSYNTDMLRKTLQYRIYPTKKQTRILLQTLEECRWVYNQTLAFRKDAWEEYSVPVSLYDTTGSLPTWKQERPSLQTVNAQVLQNVCVRVDLAFQAFFRRVRAGEKPGYPRFKGYGRYDSFTFPQYLNGGFKLKDGKLRLSKIGDLKIVLHRPIEGQIKTLTIRRTASGEWFACFSVKYEPEPLPGSTESVGIDVGLTSFATLSTGEKIENPRFFCQDEKALAKAQHKMDKEPKGSRKREKRRRAVAKIHKRIANRRKNFAHQHSRRLVNRFGTICVEDLAVNRMVHNHCLAKSIGDAAWSQFFECMTYKAVDAGRCVIPVNPAYTSQDCSRCGHRQKLSLSEREYRCPCCGLVIDRDENAARNILALGLESLGVSPRSPRCDTGE